MLTTVRQTRRLSLQLFAGALGAMAALTLAEVPLALALDWWVVEDWVAAGNLGVAVLAVATTALLLRFDPTHAQRTRIHAALLFALLAAAAFVFRLLAATDLLWVSFVARRTMQIAGVLSFDAVLALVALILVGLTPGHRGTQVHAMLRTGLGIVIAMAALTIIASVGGFHGVLEASNPLGVMTRILLGLGLGAMASATILAIRHVEDVEDVVDAF